MTPEKELLRALEMGKVCLHPAGTMPGLTCDIENPAAMKMLMSFKLRPTGKPFIGLISDLDQAFQFWRPMSKVWRDALKAVWPGHLTVIHGAEKVSFPLGEGQTLALRMPIFSPRDQWMNEVLSQLKVPLPSTSVNRSGEAPAATWKEALAFGKAHGIFVPALTHDPEFSGTPSTVIQILDDQSYRVLRKGGFDLEVLGDFKLAEKP